MRLWRIALLGTAGIALMPSDARQQERLLEQASAAARWAVTYCERNQEHCVQASAAWETFQAKAAFAGSALLDLYERHARQPLDQPRQNLMPAPASQPAAQPSRHGTLTPADMGWPWRSPSTR